MTKVKPKYLRDDSSRSKVVFQKPDLNNFGTSILGLESLNTKGKTFEALAVILDLKDFTAFCDQRDPHLVIPRFLKSFLEWFFDALRTELVMDESQTEVTLWSQLPFFGKFLGDGLLLLWNVTEMTGANKRNIVNAFDIICAEYQTIFLPSIRNHVSKPPSRLRCGIAQGLVTSIADGKDFVGLCINLSSRLQKLADGAFSFAFTKKGLEGEPEEDWYEDFKLIKIPIRGVAHDELVYVLKSEYRKLSNETKKAYRP